MKLHNISATFALAVASLAIAGCSHEEIDLYSGPTSGIFIQQVKTTDIYGNPTSYYDGKTGITFANYGSHVTGLNDSFVVRAMGEVTDYDRAYRLEVDPAETTAVEGVDFSLEGNNFCIPAGESTDVVRIKFIRHSGLIQKTVRVYFKLYPNENFDMPISEFKNSSSWNVDGDMLPTDHFYFEFGENYTCPHYWTSFGNSYWGEWTAPKYLLLNELMGWTVTDWNNAGLSGANVALGRFQFAAITMQKYLQQKADEGNPVIDDSTGTYMQLAQSYQVNYGAYITE